MKHKLTYFFILTLLSLLFCGCFGNEGAKKIPGLQETYSRADKKPFGAFIAYRQVEEMFYRNTVRTSKVSFDKSWTDIEDTASLFIVIARNLFLNETEADAMLQYVDRGNDLFISASMIDENLLKKINISQYDNSFFRVLDYNLMRNTSVNLKNTPYTYYFMPFAASFGKASNPYVRPLGTNDQGNTNCIVYFHGRGRLFLHCEPRAFSNYFLLQQNNYRYLQEMMKYTSADPDHIYWDDYYNKLNYRRENGDEGFSSLSEIMRHPPLAAAFWLIIILLLLYIIYGVKRRQRIIELVKPNENTTVTFTETIGRLYLQKKDNKNIADKMVTYFNEYIRNKYFLNTNLVNADFISTLSRKSGVPVEKVETLYRTISHAHSNVEIDDYQLMSLNEQIQQFYKRSV